MDSSLFHPSLSQGLSSSEAARRLSEEGYNEIPSARRKNALTIALAVIREPMFILLVACGAIYLLLGDIQEALILLGFVFVIMGITFIQERKTERALEALRDLSSPRASVIRDGTKILIPGREVARGDIVILAEGDRVPADASLREAVNFSVDESLLTGESVPVAKYADGASRVFSGTLVVQGRGIAEVYATGARSEMGRIGRSLESIAEEDTFLKRDIARMVRIVGISGGALCGAVILFYSLTRADWINGFLAGLTLAMAMIPEEFPVVMTVFMSLGAWRISKNRVLTRRIPAVETLGSATVLCVDKTGTLTENRMQVSMLSAGDTAYAVDGCTESIDERYHEVVEYGILASQTDPFDPMEKAIRALGEKCLAGTEHIHRNWEMIHEYPLSPSLLAMSRAWKRRGSDTFVIAAKGAPEAIADLCHLDTQKTASLAHMTERFAGNGLRVLGVARSSTRSRVLPDGQHDLAFEFLGLIGLADPVRKPVPGAIQECHRAGIRVVMITGDYPSTARSIAGQIGLRNREEVITGSELDAMSDETLKDRISRVNLFARVVPEQKLRIVQALKRSGEIVAMTGDGVNDAPALKAADIGIAMGGRGTDVARESAALVLLDDDFMSIVAAVRMGRRIFDNLKKAIAYILAVHVPIAGLSLLPVILKWPLILFPVHIVFLELIIDPACSLVFEAEREEPGIMDRPPRPINESLFSLPAVVTSVLQGVVLLGTVLAVYAAARRFGENTAQARALAFTTLIVGNIGLIMSNRSWELTIPRMIRSNNTALVFVVTGAAVFLILTLLVPFLRNLFLFGPLHTIDIILCLSAAIISIVIFELMKATAFMRAERESHQ